MRLLLVLLFLLLTKLLWAPQHAHRFETNRKNVYHALKLKSANAYQYCRDNHLNTKYCLLAHMGLHSGLKRCFVWDFEHDTIIEAGLVSHGCGSYPWAMDMSRETPDFSNEDGSHCTALGKYKIGERGYSNWGIHVKYLLHGLDKSNSRALQRAIVLHSWEDVPETEIYPDGTPEGWGCPAVSNHFMQQLDERLKDENQPVLLWIFR